MRTKAAVIREPGKPWEITELELDEPRQGEVRVAFAASGMCHSDEHLQAGDSTGRLPLVGGHEGAGVIEALGPGVTRVNVGDHVVCSFIPACGVCRYCSTGRQNLCDWGAQMMTGMLADGTFTVRDFYTKPGTYSYAASYAGDSANAPATAGPEQVTVIRGPH